MTRRLEHPAIVAIGFALLVALTQTGQISTEVIDWDESTFMLLAGRLLDGHLPYTDLYDIKPPMIFFTLAGVMAIFGESLLSVRLFGDACILAMALLTFWSLRQVTTHWPAFLAGICLIVICAIPFGQHTSAELPATAMILGALFLLLRARDRFWAIAGAGLLISLATLTRSNLGVVAVAVGTYLVIAGLLFPTSKVKKWAVLPFTIAGLIPVAGFIGLYWQAGALDTFILATVTVPLNYAENQNSMIGVLQTLATDWITVMIALPLWAGAFTFLAIAGGLIGLLERQQRSGSPAAANDFWLIIIVGVAVAFSILNSGAAFPHYLLQVFPFAAMLIAPFVTWALRRRATRWLVPSLAALVVSSSLAQTTPSLYRIATTKEPIANNWVLSHAADRIAEFIRPQDEIWALSGHLILWYLDRPPVSRVTAHPSNINRPSILRPLVAAGYIGQDELQRIYDSLPAFLVTDASSSAYYLPDPTYFATYLSTNYTEFFRADGVVVYRRLGH